MDERQSEAGSRWRRIHEDGAVWEARVIPGPGQTDPGQGGDEEILEFVCLNEGRKPRRLAVRAGSLTEMTDQQLARAYMQARPIGGDHYGRPGKPMNDMG